MTRLRSDESGFSLAELLVATGLLLIISAIVTNGLLQMTQQQATIWNRTEMHSGIRGATELLQQEVGQAGKIGFPVPLALAAAVAAAADCDPGDPAHNAVAVAVGSVNSAGNVIAMPSVQGIDPATQAYSSALSPLSMLFASGASTQLLTSMDGDKQETIRLSSVNAAGNTITACFTQAHLAGAVLMPMGAFAFGVVPPTGVADGSSGTVLKLIGDINGDGMNVFVEYVCDTASGNLYRNVVPYNSTFANKPNWNTADKILLSNIKANPGGVPCFTYQTTTMMVQGTSFTFVLDVAITLTVESEQIDPITKQKQTETKALLNVSPRNVFNVWAMASIGYTNRIQSTPTTVTGLLVPKPAI